jgi:hypothetical protein
VRRNGHAPARQVATGAGQIEVVRPRVDDRRVDPATGQRQQFQSVILPRWCRRSPKVEESSRLVVRHEVPFDRVEVQGLHRWPVAAGW